MKDVIMATANGVVENLQRGGVTELPPDNAGTFAKMLAVQIKESQELWRLNRDLREGRIKPEEFEARKKAIEEKAKTDMHTIPGQVVMDNFHPEYVEAMAEWRKKREDARDWNNGLPNRGHIGDMIRNNPNNPANHSIDAAAKLADGDVAGGRAALDKAISLGGTADAFGMRGGLKMAERDYAGAYKDALEALKLKPGDPVLMGLLKSVEGRVSPAERAAIAAAVGSSSSGATAAYRNSPAAAASRAPSGPAGFASFPALSAPREIEGMTSPAAISAGQKLAEARRAWALGDFAQAVALARRALELNPSSADAHSFLAAIYAQRGDFRASAASAAAGLALAPRDAGLLNTKAFAENRLKSWRDALASSNGAIEADPRGAWGYANRAHAYGGLGDKDSMMSDIKRAASIDGAFTKAAADAASLQLPSNADVLFLFPGEDPGPAAAPAAAGKKRSFGLVLAAGLAGGLLLALGLLSTVLAPVKESVVSAFTKVTRTGPALRPLDIPTSEPASVSGEVGGLIRGQYEIIRQIGVGGMGMVYEGTDRSLGRKVAIKKMREELRVNARERERFVIEAKTVAALRHPHIVDIYAIAEDQDDVYLVFEYVDGKTVHDVVQAQGRLRPQDAARVVRATAEALAYAHSRGVIHRDVKPSNVMFTPEGTIKVMDFGIARMAKDALTRYSITNTVVGTPPYMAPEQEQGHVRKESDVYALAVCAYEMLTGKLPFVGMGAGMLMNKINMSFVPPSRAIGGLAPALDEVFTKAFQADPDNRYRTPQEFSAALETALGGARANA
ncbi:MAG: protein kinase [Elusimicrobiota bacterium]|nr:MAG: protein kinase [Elusimicrobiota bacterium]